MCESYTSRSVMHNMCMQAVCNHMNLVRIPRRDHMYLALCVYNSRRDRDMKSRSRIRRMSNLRT